MKHLFQLNDLERNEKYNVAIESAVRQKMQELGVSFFEGLFTENVAATALHA